VGALLDGEPVAATACTPLELAAGVHDLTSSESTALTVDRVALTGDVDRTATPAAPSDIPVEVTHAEPRARDVTVGPCPDGCWVVLGEGFNDAWEASADGRPLGVGQLVDGGFNGWWLAPTTSPTRVEFRWTAQRPVTLGLAVSALGALLCVGVVLAGPRARHQRLRAPRLVSGPPSSSRRRLVAPATTLVVAAVVLIAPVWGVAALATAGASYGATAWARGRWARRVYELVGVALLASTALAVLWIERRDRPFPNAGWTTHFDHLNGLALFAVLTIAVGAMFATDAEREHR
jgi:arabinofuranan 3-O-arabinosyltransferase